MRTNTGSNYKVMSFQPASQAIPDVLGAMLLIRRRIRENPAMTQRMYDAICHVLEYIYLLPIHERGDDVPPDFIIPNEGIYERMDNRLRRLERWVIQWPHRSMIDQAFDHFRLVYRDFLTWVSNLQGVELHNRPQDYVDELEEFDSDSDSDSNSDSNSDHHEYPELYGELGPEIDRDTNDTDSVVTPPRQPDQRRRNRD